MSSSCNLVATTPSSALPCLTQHQRPNGWPLVPTATSLAFQCLRKRLNTLTCGPPTRVPPFCIMRPIVTFVNYVHNKSYTVILAIKFTTSCDFSVRPKSQPTSTVAALCHKKVGRPCSNTCKTHRTLSTLSQKPATWTHHSHLPWDIA